MTDKEIEELLEKRAEQCAQKADNDKAPDIFYLSGLVKGKRAEMRKRQNRQLTIFIFAAIAIAALMIVCFFKSVTLYVVVQLAGLAVFGASSLFKHFSVRYREAKR